MTLPQTIARPPAALALLANARVLLAAICLFPVLAYAPIVGGVLDPDEGVYGTIARGILDGQLPYRDYFDHKPPLIYAWYVVSLLVFGDDAESPRIMASLIWSATTLLLYLEARLILREQRDALMAAALFAATSALVFFYPAANTEVFMGLPVVAMLLAFTHGVRRGGDARLFLLAGVLGGLAVLTKPVAAWSLLALVAYLALSPATRNPLSLGEEAAKHPLSLREEAATHPLSLWERVRVRAPASLPATAALAAGCAAVLALPAVLFTALGAFDDYFYANVTYNLGYTSGLSLLERLVWLIVGARVFIPGAGPLILATLVALFSRAARPHFEDRRFAALGLAGAAAGVLTSGYMFEHYFVVMFPFMALLAAPVVTRIADYMPRLRVDAGARKPTLPAFALGVGAPIGVAAGLVIGMAILNTRVYLEPKSSDYSATAAYIAARTEPGDTLYVHGQVSQLYFLADRPPASRYLYSEPFHFDDAAASQALADVQQSMPKFIAVATKVSDLEPAPGREFLTFLESHYVSAGQVHDAQLYGLRE